MRAERSGVRTFFSGSRKAFLAEFQQRVNEYAVENTAKLTLAVGQIKELEALFEGRALENQPRQVA